MHPNLSTATRVTQATRQRQKTNGNDLPVAAHQSSIISGIAAMKYIANSHNFHAEK